MRLSELVATSTSVAESSGRLEKIDRLASLLARVPPAEVETAIAFLSGSPRQGRIGVGFSTIADVRAALPAEYSSLVLPEVDAAFERVGSTSGAGSTAERARLLRDLM